MKEIYEFTRMPICEDQLGFDTSGHSSFGQAAIDVANDTELETLDVIYDFAGVKTYMYY